MAYRKFKGV